MSAPPPLPRTPGGTRRFFDAYTQGMTTADVERLFTRDTPEAYRFLLRAIDLGELQRLPWHRRIGARVRLFFLAFTLKLSPARRAIYAVALAAALVGLVELFREVHVFVLPHPAFENGTLGLLGAFLLVNLLFLLEGVVDAHGWGSAKELGWATFAAVERHTRDKRLLDDLTVLVARKLPPLPVTAVAETAGVGV